MKSTTVARHVPGWVVVLLLTLGPACLAAGDGTAAAVPPTGAVAVGDPAPDFDLAGPDGNRHRLSSLRGERTVVLVFYRGVWWPFCRTQLVELQKNIEAFREAGAEIWAISIDQAEALQGLREALEIGFPTLMDPGAETIRRYGILNRESGQLPHPAAFVVDREGIVRYRRVDEKYVVRPPVEELLDAVASAGTAKSE